jgi:adenosine deaminase
LYALPKIELHRHLEGSIRLQTLCELGREFGIELPGYDPEILHPYVQVTAQDEPNLIVFLEKFGILRRFFIDPLIIRRVVREAIEDAAADNIRYMELRFTPRALAKAQGYSLDEVVGWVCDETLQASRDNHIKVNLIVSMNRHEGMDIARETTEAALNYHHQNVVGLDLAGKEPGFPARPFSQLFREARRAGLGITIHAGEWVGPEHIQEAIEAIQADRIGHGVRIVEDSTTAKLARMRGIVFEVCPTSNVQTGVVGLLQHHPLIDMRYLDLPITINTDDPAICQTTLTDEYALAVEVLGMSIDDIRGMVISAARAAFLPEDERHDLIQSLKREMGTSRYRGLED